MRAEGKLIERAPMSYATGLWLAPPRNVVCVSNAGNELSGGRNGRVSTKCRSNHSIIFLVDKPYDSSTTTVTIQYVFVAPGRSKLSRMPGISESLALYHSKSCFFLVSSSSM